MQVAWLLMSNCNFLTIHMHSSMDSSGLSSIQVERWLLCGVSEQLPIDLLLLYYGIILKHWSDENDEDLVCKRFIKLFWFLHSIPMGSVSKTLGMVILSILSISVYTISTGAPNLELPHDCNSIPCHVFGQLVKPRLTSIQESGNPYYCMVWKYG